MVQTLSRARLGVFAAAALAFVLVPGAAASAATSIDGPIDLGTSAPFAVLAGSTVTDAGTSVLTGDVGLSPGTSITGILPINVDGTIHPTDAVAAQAQIDLTTAYGVAAGLTPAQSGLGDLTGLSLTPGVYSGGELSVTGELTLAGTAQSVWIFQAASTLNIGSSGNITVTGGASACNVFWQVGSSATLEPGSQLVGTVMAEESITAKTNATITGRLLARTAAVTLDSNTITRPTGCDLPPGTVTASPEITSTAPPEGRSGDDYSFTITATGAPAPSYTVSAGALPPGLDLDTTTGVIAGQPTTRGTFDVEITASNGIGPDVTVAYAVVIAPVAIVVPAADSPRAPALAASGTDVGAAPVLAAALIAAGTLLIIRPRLRSHVGSAILTDDPMRRNTFMSRPATRRDARRR